MRLYVVKQAYRPCLFSLSLIIIVAMFFDHSLFKSLTDEKSPLGLLESAC